MVVEMARIIAILDAATCALRTGQVAPSFADRLNQAANRTSIRDPVSHPSTLTQRTLHALLQGGEFGKAVRVVGICSSEEALVKRF